MTRSPRHLDEAEQRSRAGGKALTASRERHLEGCRECQAEALFFVSTRAALEVGHLDECPDANVLLAMAEGVGNPEPTVNDHLTGCVACAIELESLTRARSRVGSLPGLPSPLARAGRAIAAGLRDLVRFEMPPSLALTTRSATTADRGFRAAMELYRGGDYAAARDALTAVAAEGGSAAELPFFLGACLLNEGRVEDAVVQFALAVKKSSKLGEYRFYYAQALLLAGRGREATKEIKKAASLPGPWRDRAREQFKAIDRN